MDLENGTLFFLFCQEMGKTYIYLLRYEQLLVHFCRLIVMKGAKVPVSIQFKCLNRKGICIVTFLIWFRSDLRFELKLSGLISKQFKAYLLSTRKWSSNSEILHANGEFSESASEDKNHDIQPSWGAIHPRCWYISSKTTPWDKVECNNCLCNLGY